MRKKMLLVDEDDRIQNTIIIDTDNDYDPGPGLRLEEIDEEVNYLRPGNGVVIGMPEFISILKEDKLLTKWKSFLKENDFVEEANYMATINLNLGIGKKFSMSQSWTKEDMRILRTRANRKKEIL